MRLWVKLTVLTAFAGFSVTGLAAGLKITEKYDDFMKETYLEAKKFSVCQPRKAGMVPCGTFQLRWRQSIPDEVIIVLETGGDYVSMTEIWFNLSGEISKFEAASSVTDFHFDESVGQFGGGLGRRSANAFIVPVATLKAVTESSDNGIVRVTGVNHVADYDFYRKHMFKLPFELLQDFVARVESVSTNADAE